MAETTRARLLAADEAAALRDAGSADELEAAARPVRRRWIAEALEYEASLEPAECDEPRQSMCRHSWLRLAAEYRDGKR